VTIKGNVIVYCGCREAVNLLKFLLSPTASYGPEKCTELWPPDMKSPENLCIFWGVAGSRSSRIFALKVTCAKYFIAMLATVYKYSTNYAEFF
jgi:hypothetical protein